MEIPTDALRAIELDLCTCCKRLPPLAVSPGVGRDYLLLALHCVDPSVVALEADLNYLPLRTSRQKTRQVWT